MVTITLRGHITEDGKLEVDLPEDHPIGEVNITIEAEKIETEWTDKELAEMMLHEPQTGSEIAQNAAIGSWADQEIEDGVEWVNEQRRKHREKRGW
jgi:hypothetical protein